MTLASSNVKGVRDRMGKLPKFAMMATSIAMEEKHGPTL